MRPAPQGPDFYPPTESVDTPAGGGIPLIDVPVRRDDSGTYPSSEPTGDTPDFIRPPSRTARTTSVATTAESSAAAENAALPLPTEHQVALDGLRAHSNTHKENPATSSGTPEQPDDDDTAETVPAGGGDTPKPPVDPPDTPSAPGSEEPAGEPRTPVEYFQVRLGSIVQSAEQVIEESYRLEGKTHTSGTVVDGVYDLHTGQTMIGGDTGLDRIEKVQATATKAVEAAKQLQAGSNPPTGTGPTDYHIDATLAALPSKIGTVDVHTVRTLVDGQPGDEVLTTTTIELPPIRKTPEMLHCNITSKGDTVVDIQLTSIPEEDLPRYKACLRALGNRSTVVDVLHGNVTDAEDAMNRLQPIVQARGEHPSMAELVNTAATEAIRIGMAAKGEREVISTDLHAVERKIERIRMAMRLRR